MFKKKEKKKIKQAIYKSVWEVQQFPPAIRLIVFFLPAEEYLAFHGVYNME